MGVKEVCDSLNSIDSGQEKRMKDFFSVYNRQYIEKKLREFTLTEFEKEKFLEYLRSMIRNCNLCIGSLNGALIVRVIEQFFNVEVSSILPNGCYELEDDFIYKEVLQKIEVVIESIKIPKYKDGLKNRIEWLSSIFGFSLEEKNFITLIYLFKYNECIKEIFDYYSSRALYTYYNDIYKTDSVNGETVEASLLKKGILIKLSNNERIVNPFYEKLLMDRTLTTRLKFEKFLIGKAQKTELTLKDFDYIKQAPLMIKILKNASKQKKKGVNILLTGVCGSGKTELVKRLSMEAGLSCYAVATDADDKEITRVERLADLNAKQAVLGRMSNACLLFDEAEDIFNRGFNENGTSSKGYLNRLLENNSVPVLYTTNNVWDMDSAFLRRFNYILETPALDKDKRFNLWSRITKKNKLKVSKKKLEELSEIYDIQPAIIANAVETTKLVDGDDETFGEIVESVATKVDKKNDIKQQKDFDASSYYIDIVNTDTNIEKLTEKLIKTKRLDFSMCLSGPSGCGKSQWAKKLLTSMGIEYIMFRPSDILSKWVGEDEQNLKYYFEQASQKKCALIIDEADSFVSERELANHSWERSIVNEFLVQMENFKYPLICTTNLMNIMDSASYRRFLVKIRFDYMQPEHFKKAMKLFFNIETDNFIRGVTPADFAVVKKEIEFFGDSSEEEIIHLLQKEVKVKKDKDIKEIIGF